MKTWVMNTKDTRDMQLVTLCLLMRGNEVCLAMKKRGFGAGKWNGVGGKVSEGESIVQAAIREMKEEIGVETNPEHLEDMGSIRFLFPEKPAWNQHMYIFFVGEWRGEPHESEEMRPEWHHKNKLPLNEMWSSDTHWLPVVLAGKRIAGTFYFNGTGETVDRFELKEI